MQHRGHPLSGLIQRGGDALYGALRRGVNDATDSLGEIQNRVRQIVGSDRVENGKLSDWIAYAAPDLDNAVQNAVERVFKLLDLPRRGDVEALNRNLERVAEAVEALESIYSQRTQSEPEKSEPKESEPEE